ncbi:hypothetical protein LCI18_013462 [Fusarium solani-melongenae]|uniref:Uncharacterized protein n=1 Tax=Fusarium solani subsp. cucurbitae TaxID=2747967 RepID=A0ACD3ZMV3_FUSSC|nr:hypothetical protein LCI18_013462 [Fusarium solani-melongenae]
MDDNTQPTSNMETWEHSPSSAELDPITSQRRGSDSLPSLNELATHRTAMERKGAVHHWLFDRSLDLSSPSCENNPLDILALYQLRDDPHDEVPFGNRTENRHVLGQVYFNGNQKTLSEQDYGIIASNRNWGNAPMLYSIADTLAPYQPETSAAAMEKFERLARDTDSIISKAATWGTRRFSVSSTESEEDTVVGNIVRKVWRRDNTAIRAGGLLRDLRGLIRRPSASRLLKRNRTTKEDEGIAGSADLQGKRVFRPPPGRMPGWANRPIPSTNPGLVWMGPSLVSSAETELADYTRFQSPPNPVVTSGNLATVTLPQSQLGRIKAETSGPQIEGVQTTSNNNNNEAPSVPVPPEDRTKPTPEQMRWGSGPVPCPSIPSLPASDAQRTRSQPVISYQAVDKDLARRRLDNMRSFYAPVGDTSRDKGPGSNRYSFENGDCFVDRGVEIFEGIRPPHRERIRERQHHDGGPLLKPHSDRYLSAKINELDGGCVETIKGDSNNVSDDEHVYALACSEDSFIKRDFSAELERPASIKTLLFPGITSYPQQSIKSERGKSAENSKRSADMGLEGSDDRLPTQPNSRQLCPGTDPVEDKPKGLITTEDSALESRATPEAQRHCEILMPGSIKSKRQVGFARVTIEIVSLPNMNSPLSGQSDDESGQSSECEIETGESFDEEQADTEDQDRPNLSPQNLPSGGSGESSSSLIGANTNPSGKNAGGGAGSSANTRSRTKASRSTSKRRTERFACPYQAFEASQPCFRPGPRNPSGGCAGIQRLKQHLSRRHMMSYRCIRCWRSFETRDRSEAHSKQVGSCEAREMLTAERFMGPNQETDLEKVSGAGCEEETWWEIFQLVIPDMQNRTRESLKSQYWPYYMHFDSFMMPSMIFPNALFESENTGVQTSGATLEETGYVTQNTQGPYLTTDPPDPAPASHTVYVPLLDASVGPPSQTGLQALQCSPASQSAASTSTPNTDPQTLTRATSTLQCPETATQPSQGTPDQTKLQRNHERLRARHSRLEEEVDEFLAANRTARSDLGRADVAINDLLALEDLPRNIEDTLSEVSQILELVRKRLR